MNWYNIHASEVFDNLKRGNEVIAIILEDNDKYTRGVYDLDTIQVNALLDLLEGDNIQFYTKSF